MHVQNYVVNNRNKNEKNTLNQADSAEKCIDGLVKIET